MLLVTLVNAAFGITDNYCSWAARDAKGISATRFSDVFGLLRVDHSWIDGSLPAGEHLFFPAFLMRYRIQRKYRRKGALVRIRQWCFHICSIDPVRAI